jgi:hypothetical protein
MEDPLTDGRMCISRLTKLKFDQRCLLGVVVFQNKTQKFIAGSGLKKINKFKQESTQTEV